MQKEESDLAVRTKNFALQIILKRFKKRPS